MRTLFLSSSKRSSRIKCVSVTKRWAELKIWYLKKKEKRFYVKNLNPLRILMITGSRTQNTHKWSMNVSSSFSNNATNISKPVAFAGYSGLWLSSRRTQVVLLTVVPCSSFCFSPTSYSEKSDVMYRKTWRHILTDLTSFIHWCHTSTSCTDDSGHCRAL